MGSYTASAVAAIVGGVIVAVVIFVPDVAYRYRRSGRLRGSDVVAVVVVPTYALALWTYTLLPLPDPDDIVCRDPNLDAFRFVDQIRASGVDSLADLLTNWAFASTVLNVLLFVPLGVILRWRFRRGVLVATVVGFAVSLLIETTQLTGLWGVYDCAYRYFDVDDLITNTTGAVVGSVLSWLVLRHRPDPEVVPDEAMATSGQRIVAVACDVVVMLLVGTATVVAWRAIALRTLKIDEAVHPLVQRSLQWGVPLALEAIAVVGFGRTIGEWAVRLGTVARRPGWTLPGRVLKLAFGPGLIAAVGWWDSGWSGVLLLVLAALSVVVAVVTPDHRGLANTVSGLRPVVTPWGRPADPD